MKVGNQAEAVEADGHGSVEFCCFHRPSSWHNFLVGALCTKKGEKKEKKNLRSAKRVAFNMNITT
jgi:hypothetical protein